MSEHLSAIDVKRFKSISNAIFDVSSLNVFVGANNSGKSTIVQMVHFGISILQAIDFSYKWGNQDSVTLSINPTDLLYSPCIDLYSLGFGGRLLEPKESAIELSMTLSSGQKIRIEIRRGRNGNIRVQVDSVNAAKRIAKLEEPFTIYSPGLAGISRSESYVSNGVLLRTIARGDANLVLRNILYRLSRQNNLWRDFLLDLQQIFEKIEISVEYDANTDEHIAVYVDLGMGRVPIELAGTGILQAVQILGYVQYFHPSAIILDEPDSHLHPNNQRLLCKLLQVIAEERSTQVFLTTHSRHVVDALSGQANFLWVRNGIVERVDQDHDLAVLLDIGALDVKEMLSNSKARCIVLTEDTLDRGLKRIMEASNLLPNDTLVLSYHGCTNIGNLRPLLDLIRISNAVAKIVVHRDRDYLSDEEVREWSEHIRAMGAESYLPDGVDIESVFLNTMHLSTINEIELDKMSSMLEEATREYRDLSIEKYVNGRSDIEKKRGTFGQINLGQLAAQAGGIIDAHPERYRHSKTILRKLRQEYRKVTGKNLRVLESSEFIRSVELADIAKKLPAG